MITIKCIKERSSIKTEKVGEIFHLDQNSICDSGDGNWYGDMYIRNKGGDFIYHGRMMISRFTIVPD